MSNIQQILDDLGPAVPFRQRRSVLSDARIKALPVTPYEMLPALGDDKLILLVSALARMSWVADYTNIDTDASLGIGVTGLTQGVIAQVSASGVSGLLAGGGPDGSIALFGLRSRVITSNTYGLSSLYDSDIVNKPLVLSLNNQAAGALLDGDVGNKLYINTVFLVYNIQTGLFE